MKPLFVYMPQDAIFLNEVDEPFERCDTRYALAQPSTQASSTATRLFATHVHRVGRSLNDETRPCQGVLETQLNASAPRDVHASGCVRPPGRELARQ